MIAMHKIELKDNFFKVVSVNFEKNSALIESDYEFKNLKLKIHARLTKDASVHYYGYRTRFLNIKKSLRAINSNLRNEDIVHAKEDIVNHVSELALRMDDAISEFRLRKNAEAALSALPATEGRKKVTL